MEYADKARAAVSEAGSYLKDHRAHAAAAGAGAVTGMAIGGPVGAATGASAGLAAVEAGTKYLAKRRGNRD